jgi:hypothetical protein
LRIMAATSFMGSTFERMTLMRHCASKRTRALIGYRGERVRGDPDGRAEQPVVADRVDDREARARDRRACRIA